ncbi:polyketide cyclase [Massilia sp. WF1]|uniref:nuclear transport factor 2 family protein n=1 Tax=unclassified Massilia TaxID=2609279 RepID=UPI00064A456B|nr:MULTISPECIES: nuclear transport factor 2 family protein [unclassified Massilia]ALK98441.1 polyketide cyclase [Massilia sp. WG5]KLU37644.1 polyketide cyclase [Massilia sp. WF1]
MNHAASHASIIAERYLAIWNERDDIIRRARIAQLFATGASYADPMMRGSGIDGIDAMIGAAQRQFPGHRFSLHGTPDGHSDVVRFSWTLAPDGGAPVAQGSDIAHMDDDGLLVRVTGFLDAA